MRTIKAKFPKSLFIPRERLDVEEGKGVIVAIHEGAFADGTVSGLRQSVSSWTRMHHPEQVKRLI